MLLGTLSSCDKLSVDKLKEMAGSKEAETPAENVVDSGPSMAEIIDSENSAEESTMVGKYFMVTGTNVLIRKGPGKSYGMQMDGYYPAHAQKGEVVKCIQDQDNNYAYVQTCNGYGWSEGWVCCDYLKAITVCPECNGTGTDREYNQCEKCYGSGHL